MVANDILISLKPQFAELIVEQKKNHEFRNYVPLQIPHRMWVYITRPISEIRYVVEIGTIRAYPYQLPEGGVGNREFNSGLKRSKYAYPVIHLDQLIHGITLQELSEQLHIRPPQAFIYLERNPLLKTYLERAELRRIF